MVSSTPRTKVVSARDVLRCTARRLRAGREIKSNNTSRQQERIHDDTVTKIWLSVGLVVENALLSTARGVRIESLGTFTLDAKGRARFFLAPDFAARYRLLRYDVCSGGCLAGGAVNSRLNVSRVAATAGSPRPEAERVVGAVLRSLRQRLAAGMPATLSFRPVAEFRCSPSGQATMKFLPEFRAKEEKVAANATRARIGVARANSKPSPWRTASASEIPTAAAVPASIGTDAAAVSAGKATSAGRRSDSVGRQRPHSASSSVSRLSIATTGRPETSHGCGSGKPSPNGDAASVTTCNSSTVASSVGHGARAGVVASRSPPDNNGEHSGRRPKTSALSRASSRCSFRARSAAQRENPDRNNNDEDDDATRTSARGEKTLQHHRKDAMDHEPAVQLGSEPRAGQAEPRHRPDPETKHQDRWLSDLLRRQTLAQAGDEGLGRLTGALKLAHVSGETSGGRVSGRDLLLALRSAGTALTSAQLAATRSVLRRQPDGRVSLAAILGAMGRGADDTPRRHNDLSGEEESVRRGSCPPASREREFEAAAPLARGAVARGTPLSGLPWERSSCQGEGVTSALPPPPPPRASRGGRMSGASILSSACLSESSSIDGALRKARAIDEEQASSGDRRRHGNHEQRHVMPHQGGDKEKSSGGTEENSGPKAEQTHCSRSTAAVPKQGRRECWGEEKGGGRGVGDGAPGLAVAEEAMAELARIVFRPPSSLERLLHVLQASKVCRVRKNTSIIVSSVQRTTY